MAHHINISRRLNAPHVIYPTNNAVYSMSAHRTSLCAACNLTVIMARGLKMVSCSKGTKGGREKRYREREREREREGEGEGE